MRMHNRYAFCHHMLPMIVLALFVSTETFAQPPRERGQREGLRVEPDDFDDTQPSLREGGIPRSSVQQRGRNDQEGVEDGVPELRNDGGPAAMRVNPGGRGDWKLGVYAYNTETGIVITRVVRGSAASRMGLEQGDRIVAINGFQIGYVDDMLYPLGYELQRQADRRGNVLLLVQNVRNDRLENHNVRLMRN